MTRSSLPRGLSLLVLGSVIGCSAVSTPPLPRSLPRTSAPPSAVPPQRLSWGDARTSNLLNFDTPADAVFVRSVSGSLSQVSEPSGVTQLAIVGQSPQVVIRLASLVRSRPFPGEWSAIGLRLRSNDEFGATLELRGNGVVLASSQLTAAAPDVWNLLAVDLPQSLDPESVELGLWVDSGPRQVEVALDDLALIANNRSIQTPVMSAIRRGADWRILGPGFETRLPSEIATASPMRLAEWSTIRMVLASVNPPDRFVSIDALGRQIDTSNGSTTYSFIGQGPDNSGWRLAIRSPGEVTLPPEQGRVDRQAPGDLNQDGYDESRNSYRVIAVGPRLDITLTPGSVPLENAIIEIDGLQHTPNLSAMLAGQVIRTIERTSSGTVLIEIPGRVERAVTLQVRAK